MSVGGTSVVVGGTHVAGGSGEGVSGGFSASEVLQAVSSVMT